MPKRRVSSVNIDRGVYAMAMQDGGQSAEITMYGEVVEERPTDRDGKLLEGDHIVQSEFLDDLAKLGGAKSLTLRMHSFGGSAGTAILIHNRLRELAAKGTELTCIVDGVAASAGSLIMCACDTVKVNATSMVMIHNALVGSFGGYNSGELQHMAALAEAWDKAQVSIYQRKTGLPEAEIARMMAETTYMTGLEAVEKGFADELIEDAEPVKIAASADGRSLFVNGRPFPLPAGLFAPDSIPTIQPEAPPPVGYTKTKGGNIMAKTLEELRREDPALAESLLAEAKVAVRASGENAHLTAPTAQSTPEDKIQAERKRLEEIDAVASLYDAETVREAKYGEHPCTAQEMTFRAAQKAVAQGRRALADLEDDAKTSGAQQVQAAGDPAQAKLQAGGKAPDERDPAQRMASARAQVKQLFGKKLEG